MRSLIELLSDRSWRTLQDQASGPRGSKRENKRGEPARALYLAACQPVVHLLLAFGNKVAFLEDAV